MDHDDSVIFLSFEGRPGIEISLDQISPGAVARAFSVSFLLKARSFSLCIACYFAVL